MPKITPQDARPKSRHGGILAARWATRHGTTSYLAAPKWRKLKSEIALVRTFAEGDKAFQACVRLSQRGWAGADAKKRASGFVQACMFGKNPRAALSSALLRASRQMKKRSGAFAGYSKMHRRTRRTRRASKRRA